MAAIRSNITGTVAVPFGPWFVNNDPSDIRLRVIEYPDQNAYNADTTEPKEGIGATYAWHNCPGLSTADARDADAQILCLQADPDGDYYNGTLLS